MRTSIWHCGACGADGTVDYVDDTRAIDVVGHVVREHDRAHPLCHRRILLQLSPRSSMRVPSRDTLPTADVC